MRARFSMGVRVLMLLLAAMPEAAAAQRNAGPRDAEGGLRGLIGRSDVVLERPNLQAAEALPLGNGRLGVAVWSAEGMTLQLNRADTMPHRLSPGQVVLPGLQAMTRAADYAGRLNLYDGSFEESGGGLSARVYVQPGRDTVVIEVAGAPAVPQTARLHLWEPRVPVVAVAGKVGLLRESWVDAGEPGASGQRFGSAAAITAEGRDVRVEQVGDDAVEVTVTPDAGGRFRILVAAPAFAGDETALDAEVRAALADGDADEHAAHWNRFWQRAGAMKITSPDGVGEYMENLRALYLFGAEAESGGRWPGSQAGVGDLFSSVRDEHQWDPAAFWHWNLRMQVAANLRAGLPELNEPYFRLYRDNLQRIQLWTRTHMRGAPGICIPETMRFNGNGIEFEQWTTNKALPTGLNCDASSPPYYNARTLSTGAEVSFWIWQQYLATGDRAFLARNFPVLAEAARFLLSYETAGADGLRHTEPSNAHEQQWDVRDPTTDLLARRTLYAETVKAAKLLGQEPALARQMQAALRLIPELPVIAGTGSPTLVNDAAGRAQGVIGDSYRPGAAIHNHENIGLEPVWPYGLIGDTSPLFAMARRTYRTRAEKASIDWSFDPVQAARLGLGDEVRSTLIAITEGSQRFINGYAQWGGNGQEFYMEQAANVALALEEALVQDYDGEIRIAPAVPAGWDIDGTVAVRNGIRVSVQRRDGVVQVVRVSVAASGPLRIRNPWPGEAVRVAEARTGTAVRLKGEATVLSFMGRAGSVYALRREGARVVAFAEPSGVRAGRPKTLGPVEIGLGVALSGMGAGQR